MSKINLEKITRVEVIDHIKSCAQINNSEEFGRVYVKYGIKINLLVQDEGKTLKIIVNKRERR